MLLECSNLPGMEFKPAALSDIPEIADLFLRCWHVSYADVLSLEARDSMNLESATELWSKAMSTNLERKTFLALENEEFIGVFRVGSDPQFSQRGHLFSLYVSPSSTGKGYGKLLLERAMEEISSDGFGEMSLWLFNDNTIAKSLYLKYGFAATGEQRITPEWNALEVEMVNPRITVKS
jgi:ribosomal protein S18 acetylase RimI-like enzyme